MRIPSVQIVMDCKGERVTKAHLRQLETLVGAVIGSERVWHSRWVTRTDLKHEFLGREVMPVVDRGIVIEDERFHEPSFDLYLRDNDVPIGRLVNVEVKQW